MPRDWNQHYADPAYREAPPDSLLVEVAEVLPPGEALDIACGSGRHAAWLASLGWRVTAVDRSPIAIAALHRRAPAVAARVADLERGEFVIEAARYDLVCDFFYLQRDLLPTLRAAVRPGGAFVGAMHLVDAPGDAQHGRASYRLESGELRECFSGWKILFYSEAPEAGHRRRAARIVARRA